MNPSQYQIQYFPQPFAGIREYSCSQFIPSGGIWEFKYDGEVLLYGGVTSWAGEFGDRADLEVELLNWGNQVPGTATSPSVIDRCSISIANQDFEVIPVADSQLHVTLPTEHGIRRVGESRLEVWDRTP